MKKIAIYTVISEDAKSSTLSLESSRRLQPNLDHYIYYENSSEQINELIKQFPKLIWKQIDEQLLLQEVTLFERFLDFGYHHPALFHCCKQLMEYDKVVYISEHIHIMHQFNSDHFNVSKPFIGPQLASPVDMRFITNSFKEAHKLSDAVYLSIDLLCFDPKLIKKQNLLQEFEEFAHQLYYQNRISDSVSESRIGIEKALNAFCSTDIGYHYLPQNYMLDIEYTIDYTGPVIGIYQKLDIDYTTRLDKQVNFLEIDYFENVYHLEYMVLITTFISNIGYAKRSDIDYNLNYLQNQIIMRNKIYQSRLQ